MADFETLKSGWYLIKTKVREELRAVDNLENQNFEAYCPQYIEKKKEVPLFPGYIFVLLSHQDIERYHKIRSSRGVSAIVTFNTMSQKRFEGGYGSSSKCELQDLLPRPIPGGHKIIDQIEEIIWSLNGCQPGQKPASVTYEQGDRAAHKNPLYKHLEFTFLHGDKNQRGLFLVQYIESLRTEEGVERRLISEQRMDIPYKELEKA